MAKFRYNEQNEGKAPSPRGNSPGNFQPSGKRPNTAGEKTRQVEPPKYGESGAPLRGANKPSYGIDGRAVSSISKDQSMSHATGLGGEVGGSPGENVPYRPFGDGSKVGDTERKS